MRCLPSSSRGRRGSSRRRRISSGHCRGTGCRLVRHEGTLPSALADALLQRNRISCSSARRQSTGSASRDGPPTTSWISHPSESVSQVRSGRAKPALPSPADSQPVLSPLQLQQRTSWRPAAEVFPMAQMVAKSLRGRDIVQDNISDCSLVSALIVGAEHHSKFGSKVSSGESIRPSTTLTFRTARSLLSVPSRRRWPTSPQQDWPLHCSILRQRDLEDGEFEGLGAFASLADFFVLCRFVR